MTEKEDLELLEAELLSVDKHARAGARRALHNAVFREGLYQFLESSSPELKVQAALVLESLQVNDAREVIEKLLNEEHEDVIEVALLWAGRQGISDVLPKMEAMLADGRIPASLCSTHTLPR